MTQDFIVQKWSVWPPLEGRQEQGLSQAELLASIPRMLKRRLTPLAKTVFSAIYQCVKDNEQLPIVFSSSHGELAKSFHMMEMIEAGEEISPTTFSLSVHNAIAGLYSMVHNNKRQSTVLAPGEEGIAPAFIEALGLLQEGEDSVLVVFYDEPLVEFYPSEPYRLSTDNTCAVALIIAKTGAGVPLRFTGLAKTGNDGEQPVQLPLLINFLQSESPDLIINTPRHSWCWQRT